MHRGAKQSHEVLTALFVHFADEIGNHLLYNAFIGLLTAAFFAVHLMKQLVKLVSAPVHLVSQHPGNHLIALQKCANVYFVAFGAVDYVARLSSILLQLHPALTNLFAQVLHHLFVMHVFEF